MSPHAAIPTFERYVIRTLRQSRHLTIGILRLLFR